MVKNPPSEQATVLSTAWAGADIEVGMITRARAKASAALSDFFINNSFVED
jgi:hypothetical protein